MFSTLLLTWCIIQGVVVGFSEEERKTEDRLRGIRHNARGSDESYFKKRNIKSEYDFIIIGGGAAGSVLASRLSEIPGWSVLLAEAGDEETIKFDIPLIAPQAQGTKYDWKYKSERNEHYCTGYVNEKCNLNLGKSLGGSTAINYMIYTRGHRADYDSWAEHGNTGWAYDDILPYFIKSENNRIPELQNSPFHSSGGYLNVEYPPYRSTITNAFLEAGIELGYSSADYNNGSLPESYSLLQTMTENGNRESGSKAFLRPIKNRPNLDISLQTRVLKIIIDEKTKTAVGVALARDKKLYLVQARKEVILSAGGLNSPKLLMLSGIGPREHLEQLGISVLSDLPVGDNLQDHVTYVGLSFLVNTTGDTIVADVASSQENQKLWLTRGQGPLTVPVAVEGLGFARTKGNDDPEERPDIELVFITTSRAGDKDGARRNVSQMKPEVYQQLYRNDEQKESWFIAPMQLRPRSRGTVRLRSRNLCDQPTLVPNYYDDERDLDVLVEGIKIAINISETKAFKKFGTTRLRNAIPGCEHEEFESDEYWKCCVRAIGASTWHFSGTCKMGPRKDKTSVVSPRLNVRGIKRLRVVDASIMPTVPSAHTTAPTYMVAEKASDMIKRYWRQHQNSNTTFETPVESDFGELQDICDRNKEITVS